MCTVLQSTVGAPLYPLTLTFMEEEIKTCGSPGLPSSRLGVCLSTRVVGHAVCLRTVPCRMLHAHLYIPPPFIHPCSLPLFTAVSRYHLLGSLL